MDHSREIDLQRPETWPASAREYLRDQQRALEETPLLEVMRQEIRGTAPITFARFMEQALYHPQHGYYTAAAGRIGAGGDYVTAPTTHPAFGALLARRIVALWERQGRPQPFVVAEAGAATGALAEQILRTITQRAQHGAGEPGCPPRRGRPGTRGAGGGCGADRGYPRSGSWGRSPGEARRENEVASISPSIASVLQYRIIEPFPGGRAAQEARLAGWEGRVTWFSDLEDQPDPPHVLLANELLDALPVHRVVWREQGLQELFVAVDAQGELQEQDGPPSTPKLEQYFSRLGLRPPEDTAVEVSLAAVSWLRRAMKATPGGWIWLLDYGAEAGELYSPPRAGTLRAFHDHALSTDPFVRMGGQDLTADVDFTTLKRTAEAEGWRVEEFTMQRDLLLSLGLEEWLRPDPAGEAPATGTVGGRWDLLRLVDPQGMGKIRSLLLRDGAKDGRPNASPSS
jgi:SAM-dependent MidA family methyltransferase